MTTLRKKYCVTFYFDYAKLTRWVSAYSVSQAIAEAGKQVFSLNLKYNAVIAETVS